MSHHRKIMIGDVVYGHVRITNDGIVISIWINQPWGDGQLFIPETPTEEQQ